VKSGFGNCYCLSCLEHSRVRFRPLLAALFFSLWCLGSAHGAFCGRTFALCVLVSLKDLDVTRPSHEAALGQITSAYFL